MSFSRLTSGFLSRVVSQGSTLVLLVLGAQFLTPAEFGIYTLASIAVALANVFLFSGAYEQVLRSDNLERDGPLALSTLVLTAFLAAVILLSAGWILQYGETTGAFGRLLQWFSVVPLLAATAAWREAVFLRAPANLTTYFKIAVLRDLAALVLGAGLLFWGLGLWAMVIYRISLAAFGYLAFYGVQRRLCPVARDPAEISHLLIRSMPLTGSRLLSFLSNNGMDVAVGVFLSPAAVGIYRMASRFVLAVYDIVCQPMMKHAWVHMAEETRMGLTGHPSLRRAQGFSLILVACACMYLTVGRTELVDLILGPQWASVAPLIPLFSAAALFTALGQFVEPVLSLRNQGPALFRLRLGTTLLLMGAVASGAYLAQLDGAAFARLGGAAWAALAFWWGMWRWGGIPLALAREALIVAAGTALLCLAVGLAIFQMPLNAYWRLGIHAFATVAVAMLLVWCYTRYQAKTAPDSHARAPSTDH